MALIACSIIFIIISIGLQFGHAQTSGACQGDNFGDAGDFDLYILEQSWPAKFCDNQPSRGCKQPTPYMRVNLTIHGLWPSYTTQRRGSKWPQCCATTEGVEMEANVFHRFSSRLQNSWPDFKKAQVSPRNSIWEYEWGKHGTCAGTTQMEYFEAALDMSDELGTPPPINLAARGGGQGSTVAKHAVEAHYGNGPCVVGQDCMVVLECQDGELLSVTTCWDTNYNSIMCPLSIIQGKQRRKCPQSIFILTL